MKKNLYNNTRQGSGKIIVRYKGTCLDWVASAREPVKEARKHYYSLPN